MKNLFLHLKVVGFTFFEEGKVLFRYYRRLKFALLDIALHLVYFFQSPYHISKGFWKKRGASNVYLYGETPLSTLDQIAKECRLLSHDHILDLGCGRGRSAFWLAYFVGCTVHAVDIIPTFIRRAERLKKWGKIDRAHFEAVEISHLPFEKASVIYFYGSSYSDEFIEKVVEKCRSLKKGTKIISVSYPLTEFCKEPLFEVKKSFLAKYPWGTTEVFLHHKL